MPCERVEKDGLVSFVCTRSDGPDSACACGAEATLLCDGRAESRRGTCDEPICEKCAHLLAYTTAEIDPLFARLARRTQRTAVGREATRIAKAAMRDAFDGTDTIDLCPKCAARQSDSRPVIHVDGLRLIR